MKNLTYILALLVAVFGLVKCYPAQDQYRRGFPSGKQFYYTAVDTKDRYFNSERCYLNFTKKQVVCEDNDRHKITIHLQTLEGDCYTAGRMTNVSLFKMYSDGFHDTDKIFNIHKSSKTLKRFYFQFGKCPMYANFSTANKIDYE